MKCFSFYAHNEAISDVLSTSKKVLELGSSALQVFPVPGLPIAVDVLIALIDRVDEVQTTEDGLKELSDEIAMLAEAIKQTSQETNDGMQTDRALRHRLQTSSELPDRFTEFHDILKKLKMQADELYKGPFILRCLHSSRDAETLEKLQRGVAKALRFFNLKCQNAIEQVINEVLGAVKDLKADSDLDALPHIDANYCAHVNMAKSNFLAETRTELLKKLEDWVRNGDTLADDGSSSKPICVLTGGVGTGKSTIASELAKRLDIAQLPKHYGASFFFDCQVEELSSTKLFFTTIAHELARVQSAFRQPTVMAAREYLVRGKVQQIGNAGALVQKAISKFHGEPHSILLVVDAVDECKETQLVPLLLDILVDCVHKAPFPLKVFVTSRSDHNGRQHILSEHSDKVHEVSLDDLSPKSVTDDISTFLRHRFSQTAPGKKVLNIKPKLIESLASFADQNFLVASMTMEFLESEPQRNFEARLQKLLTSRTIRDGSSLQPTARRADHQSSPRDALDGLYLSILETAFPSGNKKHQEELRVQLQIVLGCVALLSDHLSASAIEAFTSVSREDSRSVLQKLRAVLSSDGSEVASDSDAMFRPTHSSFPQFLVDPARCTNPLYLVDKPRESARIAQGCLNAVMSLAPNSGAGVAGTKGLAAGATGHVSPHVRYACLHWASHFGEAKKTTELNTALDRFTAPETMNKWVETLGQLGRLDIAEAALDSVSNLEEPKHETRERLVKVRQLVVDHYEEIENSPSMVYSFETGTKEDSARGASRNPHAGKSPQRKETEYFDAMSAFPGGYPKDSA